MCVLIFRFEALVIHLLLKEAVCMFVEINKRYIMTYNKQ